MHQFQQQKVTSLIDKLKEAGGSGTPRNTNPACFIGRVCAIYKQNA
jgi:hypothetical protein